MTDVPVVSANGVAVTGSANTVTKFVNSGGAAGGLIQNFATSPVWINTDSSCPAASPSIYVPAADSVTGLPGQFKFDFAPEFDMWCQSTAALNFSFWIW